MPDLRELALESPHSEEVVREAITAFAPLDRLYLSENPLRWISVLGPVRELVCSLPSFQWRLRSDSSTARLRFWSHAWERVGELAPLPGIERVILEADPPECPDCKRMQLTPTELGARLHAVVET